LKKKVRKKLENIKMSFKTIYEIVINLENFISYDFSNTGIYQLQIHLYQLIQETVFLTKIFKF